MAIDRVKPHLVNSGESLEQYLHRKRIALAGAIRGRRKIYLDTKYWISLRDVRLGRSKSQNLKALLCLLESLVAAGKVICPISADVFIELFNQTDPDTLLACAELADELSSKVSLLSLDERMRAELYHFFEAARCTSSLHPLDDLVWSKSAYVLGFTTPDAYLLPNDLNIAMQKAFLDEVWDLGLVDMLKTIGADVAAATDFSFKDMSKELNDGKFGNLDVHTSFKSLYLAEVAGILDAYGADLASLIRTICRNDTGAIGLESEANAAGKMLMNLIYHACALDRLPNELPMLRIEAGLHAALRWDKRRKYDKNDTFDFRHASGALAYCDVFLTERPLCQLVADGNLKFPSRYHCIVAADPKDAITAVEKAIS